MKALIGVIILCVGVILVADSGLGVQIKSGMMLAVTILSLVLVWINIIQVYRQNRHNKKL